MMILGGLFKLFIMYYLYLKNRILFSFLFALAILLGSESIMYFLFNEEPKLVSIIIEVPFFLLAGWYYHYRVTKKRKENKKSIF